MKILLLTQWFDPEPCFKGLAFARQLARRGDTVEILTGFPNYPEGKVYPGYRIRPWQVEWMEGFRVCRVALYPSHDRSALRRSVNYVSFALASAIAGLLLVHRPDVIYVYHPPGTIGIPALLLRWWFSAPIVYDVQDLWPDTITATGMVSHPLVLSWLDRFCRLVYRHADQLVVLSPGFRRALIDRGVPENRIEVIYNWAPDQVLDASPDPTPPCGQKREFRVVFAGAMGAAQALDAVLDAAAICLVSRPEVRFLLVGSGIDHDRLQQRAVDLQLSNVSFAPWQPLAAVGSVFEKADTLLVHLKDDPLFRMTIPSKTQAYLAAGRPILMAVRGDAADLVARAGAGILAQPGDAESIAAAVGKLASLSEEKREEMGRNGRVFYDRELAIGVGVERFREVFRHVCERHSARHRDSARGFFMKRVIDILGASLGLVCLSPLLLAIALLVRATLGRPVLFRQLRPGYRALPFRLCKFRTMTAAVDGHGVRLPDRDRLHPFGTFLRRTSLDELPELWNVLCGHMSLVGPRPLLMEYLPCYSEEERIRFSVRPGITGWAQVNGRNETGWNERLRQDIWYVHNQSLRLDLAILWKTLGQVGRRDGVIAEPHSAMLDLNEERATVAPEQAL